jgi:hypothetical protein
VVRSSPWPKRKKEKNIYKRVLAIWGARTNAKGYMSGLTTPNGKKIKKKKEKEKEKKHM